MRPMFKQLLLAMSVAFAIGSEGAVSGLLKDQIMVSDGYRRTYDLYLPGKILNKAVPLILLLHGHRGDADVMTGENGKRAPYKVWLSIAEREGLILLIPDGEYGSDNYRGWNDCREDARTNPPTDDVKFLDTLVDVVSEQYPVDPGRVYASGTSNGGNMVYRLAQEAGDKYKAVAAIVAAMPEKNKCSGPERPISVLIMNGTQDPILPYAGGGVGRRKSDKEERGSVLSAAESVEYWATNNGISSRPSVKDYPDINTKDGSTVRVKHYVGGRDNTEVVLYEIRGGGHTEPSRHEHYRRLYSYIVGKQNKDIEMAEEVWRFFARNR
jgi:polyhydroxybutyrate depolymerase